MNFIKILSIETLVYRPRFKCGADPVSAAITGGSNFLSSFVEGEYSKSNVNRQLEAQSRENQLNRDWQTEEAEKARSFTTAERLAQQGYQTGEREAAQQFSSQEAQKAAEREAMYNSPVYQSGQLRQAGINPAVYFGNHASFGGSSAPAASANGGSAPSGASSPMPSGVQGLSPVGFTPPDFSSALQGAAQMVKALADAKKTGMDTRFLEETFEERVNQLTLGNEEKKALIDGFKLDNALKRARLPYEAKKAAAELNKLYSEILLNQENTELAVSQQRLNELVGKVQSALAEKTDRESKLILLQTNNYVRDIDSIIELRKSEAYKNRKQGKLFGEQTETQKYENTFLGQTQDGRIAAENARNDVTQSTAESIKAEAAAEAEIAANRASHAEELFWKDFIIDIVNTGTDIADVWNRFKFTKSYERLSEAQKAHVEARIKDMEDKYSPTSTRTYVYDQDGKPHLSTQTDTKVHRGR